MRRDNPTAALHEHGYFACMSYEGFKSFWGHFRPLGVDFCGGTVTCNRLESGNLYNLSSVFSLSGFTVNGGTAADNVITLSEGGTVTCANIPTTKYPAARVDLEVDFDGELTLTGGLGEFRGDRVFDGADGPLVIATAVFDSKVNFTLTASAGEAVIREIRYKVSLC